MKHRFIAALLCAALLVSLSACGGGSDLSAQGNGTPESPGNVAQTSILTAEQLAERDGVVLDPDETVDSDPDETEGPDEALDPDVDETEDPDLVGEGDDDVPGIVAPDISGGNSDGSVSDLNPNSSNGYRFQDFVLNRAGTSNAVFSGESLLTSMDMWREMVGDPEKTVLKRYIARDYLGFESTSAMTMLNRIWVDDDLTTGSTARLKDMFQSIDMAGPSATTTKNKWVSDSTGGYITYTPSSFTDTTYMDLMNVLYFRDTWATGTKPYDTKERRFFNADGTEVNTVMFRDEGLTYWELDNAVAYCMYFSDGFYAMIVLPDSGVDMKDVDIQSLMTGKVASKKAHVKFYMPEFTTESSYVLRLSNFSLSAGSIPSTLVSGLPSGFEPTFSQVAKISFARSGAGDAEPGADAPAYGDEYADDLDTRNIICNRPFMYYVGDAKNEDIAFFGVVNAITPDMAVSAAQAGIS